ncbi:hypothetical protein D3879_22305 [Pseudomonas cavernicola]|uniref:10 kDa chaperonin n=1 Tax=Pseudomonas cavernicola TaxID=2320866 RepID=A0A418X803_9PSED|nr:hypothetical protein D3879_22220 [Pseudomonas cavernicola]RJG08630.1 hypothetical protein D3879_22305 [Pseudomonas cavernicola]
MAPNDKSPRGLWICPEKTKTTDSIVLPEEVAERPNRGVVIAVGSGRGWARARCMRLRSAPPDKQAAYGLASPTRRCARFNHSKSSRRGWPNIPNNEVPGTTSRKLKSQ